VAVRHASDFPYAARMSSSSSPQRAANLHRISTGRRGTWVAAVVRGRVTRPTILLVDDNSMTRRFVQAVLRTEGVTIVEAVSASAALAVAKTCKADLVLLDIVLPDGSGFDLIEPLRAALGAPVPVLAVTGLISRADEGRLGSAGFDDVVVKPIDATRLRAAVRAYLPEHATSTEAFGTGKRIVLADDDPVQRKLSVFCLSRVGFEVHAAADGGEALTLARNIRPDVIVSDVLMPGVDGFELCTRVRGDAELARVPLILLTNSYVEDADRTLATNVGADGFVIRTHDFRELIDTLKTMLSTSERVSCVAVAEAVGERTDRLVRTAHQLDRQLGLNVALTQRTAVLSAQLRILGGLTSALVEEGEVESSLDQALHACLDAGGISWGLLLVRQRDQWTRRALGLTDAEQVAVDGSIETLVARLGAAASSRMPIRVGGELVGLERGTEALVVPVVRRDELLGAIVLRYSETLDEQRTAFVQVVAGQLALVLALARTFLHLEDTSKEERARAQLLASTLDAIGKPLLVVDRNGRALRWNAAGEEYRFLTDEPSAEWLEVYSGDQSRRLQPDEMPIACALRGTPVDDVEICVRVAGSDPRWLRVTARAVEGDEGRPDGAVAVLRDVTEDRRAQARQIVNDRLASVGVLAAGVAHEINNPLTSVLAEIEMAVPHIAGKDRAIEHLNTALDAAHRVRTIVSDLRTLSRDGTHDGVVPVVVSRALDTALRMAVPHTRGRVEVRTELDEVPPVLANEGRLVQVFLNLVVNAAQAMPAALPAERRVIRVRVASSDGGARIDIADRGIGMTADVRARIFTPFFTTKPIGTGTGLGLSICQRIVTQLGGTIDCDSAPDRGTTFTLWIPAAPVDALGPPQPPSSGLTRIVPRLRVLIVDADPFVRQSVTRALRSEHDVVSLESADAAWTRIEGGEPFDLVLYETGAPGLDARALWGRLAQSHALRDRIVFLTGRTVDAQLRDFVTSVSAMAMDKPIDAAVLRSWVTEHASAR
jgi:DNA-binding response OmpR family regulator/signal transduction histidine kinase